MNSLLRFKSTYAIYGVVIYGLFTSIRDFFYIEEIFSCTKGYNLCHRLPLSELFTNTYIVQFLFILKAVLFILLLYKPYRKMALVSHILILSYLFFINRFFYTPEMAYLHFLFFCLLFCPKEEGEFMPSYVFKPFEIVVYLSYTFSGYFKMNSLFWMDGWFLTRFLTNNQVVLPYLDGYDWTSSIFYYLSFFVLSLELFAVMALFSPMLKVIFWTGLTLMHVTIFVITDLTEVSFGMIVTHLFLLDSSTVEFYSLLKTKISNLWSVKKVEAS